MRLFRIVTTLTASAATGRHRSGTAQIWDAKTGALQTKLEGHTDAVGCCTFSPDGLHVLTASDDEAARPWNVAL